MIEGLLKCNTLRYLNLSKNQLEDKISDSLKELLENDRLKELYLHWNFLKCTFAKNVLPILNDSSNLRVLDLSNNSLGPYIN